MMGAGQRVLQTRGQAEERPRRDRCRAGENAAAWRLLLQIIHKRRASGKRTTSRPVGRSDHLGPRKGLPLSVQVVPLPPL